MLAAYRGHWGARVYIDPQPKVSFDFGDAPPSIHTPVKRASSKLAPVSALSSLASRLSPYTNSPYSTAVLAEEVHRPVPPEVAAQLEDLSEGISSVLYVVF
jgi:hypothetical protein